MLKFNNLENKITIEIIDELFFEKNSYGYSYNNYKKNNKNEPLPDKYKSKLKQYEINIYNYIKKISPLNGFSNKKQKNVIFYLNVSYHFITKFIRQEIEDPLKNRGMINPDLYECIQIIENNINDISDIVLSNQSKPKLLIKIKDMTGLEFVVSLIKKWKNKRDKKNKYKVDLTFITQIKGRVKLSNQEKRDTQIIKMFRNNKINESININFKTWDEWTEEENKYENFIPYKIFEEFLIKKNILNKFIEYFYKNKTFNKKILVNYIDNCLKIDYIEYAFDWDRTPEGFDYWDKINDEWMEYFRKYILKKNKIIRNV